MRDTAARNSGAGTDRAVTTALGAPATAVEVSWLRRRRSVLGTVLMFVGVSGWVL